MHDFQENFQQRSFWSSEKGEEYMNRNLTLENVNQRYVEQLGISVEGILSEFFSDIDRETEILEFGCNVGLNLEGLKNIGFKKLTGVEINENVCKLAKERNPSFNIINSSIENFKTNKKYDLVFTSGVLIHINPKSINSILTKILSFSKKYIWGLEYFSEEISEVSYRGSQDICWKQNFPEKFKEINPKLQYVKEQKYNYIGTDNFDIAYLFKII